MLNRQEPKLTGVYLENFQSLRNEPVFLNLEKLCLFYGPNSAGKSAVIDALELLKKTVDNEDDYRLELLYEKHSAQYLSGQLKVGIEFVVGNFESFGKVNEWYQSKDPHDDYDHQYVFKRILGKKLQIEFSDGGKSIKVACDGIPAFEFLHSQTIYDETYKKITSEKRQELENNPDFDPYEYSIHGQLILYKNNFIFENIFKFCVVDYEELNSDSNSYLKNSYFYDLFFSDFSDKLIINGLEFDAQEQHEFLVNVNWRTSQFLETLNDPDFEHPKKYEDSKTNYFVELARKDEINNTQNLRAALENDFKIPNSYLRILQELADGYSKLLKGIFFQISSALDYSHVRGDRQVLNSDFCFSYSRNRIDSKLKLQEPYRSESDPIRIYAEYLSDKHSFYLNNLKFKGDFVNHCFDKYLISLKGYKIKHRVYDVVRRDLKEHSPSNTLIYLDIVNKSGKILGFQDVGSGISYVLPIITSIWCKQLSFIEQPELHLHPKAQCELADIFIASIKFNNSSVIETHSEHLLLRIARRIRETTKGYLLPDELKITPDDINIYFFDPQPNGSTSVKNIRIDKYGELLDRWPGGFFSERDKELFDE
jgi:predicted ATPase